MLHHQRNRSRVHPANRTTLLLFSQQNHSLLARRHVARRFQKSPQWIVLCKKYVRQAVCISGLRMWTFCDMWLFWQILLRSSVALEISENIWVFGAGECAVCQCFWTLSNCKHPDSPGSLSTYKCETYWVSHDNDLDCRFTGRVQTDQRRQNRLARRFHGWLNPRKLHGEHTFESWCCEARKRLNDMRFGDPPPKAMMNAEKLNRFTYLDWSSMKQLVKDLQIQSRRPLTSSLGQEKAILPNAVAWSTLSPISTNSNLHWNTSVFDIEWHGDAHRKSAKSLQNSIRLFTCLSSKPRTTLFSSLA